MTLKEAITGAVKAEIGRQLNSQPLLGNAESSDWHAEGGSLDLSQVADAVIATIAASGTHVVVPAEKRSPSAEQVARAVMIASNEAPTAEDKQLAAESCLLLSGHENVPNEGDMVLAVADMIRDHRAMLSASLTHSEGGK